MFIQQKLAKSMTRIRDLFIPSAVRLSCAQSNSLIKKSNLRDQLIKMSVFSSGILLFVLTTLPPAFAENSKAKPQWYRYYNSQGIPTLSNTISEQHLQYGYDSLDKNMRLIKHFSPFSGQNYAQQQAQREQAAARRIAERHLQETYMSSDRAASQRDREIADLDGQINRGQQQTVTLSSALNENITLAANLERQNKPIPSYLKKQLQTNKDLLKQSQTNIAALKIKREHTRKQFNDAIAVLKGIEQRGNKSSTSTTSTSSTTTTTYK